MIFATVGTQLPFPRLIRALAELASQVEEEILAQTGAEGGTGGAGDIGAPLPRNLSLRKNMTPAEFEAALQRARVVVGHAGIGTILSARRLGKPLVILPRRHSLGEHRNDHQLATAVQVDHVPGIHVAWQTEDLIPILLRQDLACQMSPTGQTPGQAALVARLRAFIG